MSVSDIDIINQGLFHIGESSIASLIGGLKRQEVAAGLYNSQRQALLSEINWRFATHTQALAQKAGNPANTKWKFHYALPTDPVLLKVQYSQPNVMKFPLGIHRCKPGPDGKSRLILFAADLGLQDRGHSRSG